MTPGLFGAAAGLRLPGPGSDTARAAVEPGPPLLRVVCLGAPKGAQRPRAFVRGRHAAVHLADSHVQAEARIVADAVAAWGCRPKLDVPVELHVTAWHALPQSRRRKRDAGSPAQPYTGKPDADNVAKLVMDALTRAGVWVDDTRVARLVVERWYLPLDGDSCPVGLERVELEVWPCRC